jgi:hypothetical protein
VRKLWLLGLVVLALLVPATVSAIPTSTHGTHVLVPGCGGSDKAKFKPSKIIIACGDGNLFVDGLSWSSWGASTAKGKGTGHQNTCSPSCAKGKFKKYPMKVKLSAPHNCAGKTEFAELKYTWTGKKRPKGSRKSTTLLLGCSP